MPSNLKYFINYIKTQFDGRFQLLTYKDIAKIASIRPQTLYNDKSAGLLIPIDPNSRNPRFSAEEVYAYFIRKGILTV